MRQNTKSVTFEDVMKKLHDFRQKRGWLNLDSADLAKSIVLEAAELLECYQWDNTEIKKHKSNAILKKNKQEIAFEAADIFLYILEFCEENDIDLLKAAWNKIEYCYKKYPVEEIKNNGRQAYYEAKKRYKKTSK